MTRNLDINRRVGAGFTLAELMVAAAVGSILLIAVLGMMSNGSDSYATATGRIDANVEARAALTTIAADLTTARYSDSQEGSFEVRQGGDPWPSSEMWFFALKPRSAQERSKASGDLCFVYYYTAVTQELEGTAGPVSRKLYRRLVSSAEVMERLRDGDDFRDPDPDPERLEDEAVAFNVVQFLAEPKVRNGTTGREDDWTRELGRRPDYVDVTLRVTDDRTAALLPEEADWLGDGPIATQYFGTGPDDIARGKRLHTYKTRIPFDD